MGQTLTILPCQGLPSSCSAHPDDGCIFKDVAVGLDTWFFNQLYIRKIGENGTSVSKIFVVRSLLSWGQEAAAWALGYIARTGLRAGGPSGTLQHLWNHVDIQMSLVDL